MASLHLESQALVAGQQETHHSQQSQAVLGMQRQQESCLLRHCPENLLGAHQPINLHEA